MRNARGKKPLELFNLFFVVKTKRHKHYMRAEKKNSCRGVLSDDADVFRIVSFGKE